MVFNEGTAKPAEGRPYLAGNKVNPYNTVTKNTLPCFFRPSVLAIPVLGTAV